MKGDFVDMWESRSEEDLFAKYIKTVSGARKTGIYQRHSAARILARRKHLPTGEVLINWLNNPKKGIGKYEESEWGTVTSPPSSWYVNDAEELQVIQLATESIGLMSYEGEHKKTKDALEKLVSGNCLKRYCAKGTCLTQEIFLDRLAHTYSLISWALKRLNDPNEPETNIENDMLLYIATAWPDFFREKAFKKFATEMISSYGEETARKYIEALRKVPDIRIPAESGKNSYASNPCLIPLAASIGFKYGCNQEEFENACQELFNIVKTSRGFERGVSHTTRYFENFLYDGSSATLNDGVELTVKEYIDKVSIDGRSIDKISKFY